MSQAVTDYTSQCPLCAHALPRTVYQFEDFDVLKCDACANAWRSNMYDEGKIEQIYCEDDYQDNPYFACDPNSEQAARSDRFANYRRALARVTHYIEPGRLLDIGCGIGAFLRVAGEHGWTLEGVEISPELAEQARANVPTATVTTGRFETLELASGGYDLITMWDVIEHVIDPVAVVCAMRGLLRPGGLMVFCTPDEGSLLAGLGHWLYRLSRGRYFYPAYALHPPAHTYFFSRPGFANLLQAARLKRLENYSQKAFFEHSQMASATQKFAIASVETGARLIDRQYEMIVIAQANADANAQ